MHIQGKESRRVELDRALAEIDTIRGQLARVTEFRGYGPASIAASGLLAFGVAALQARWLRGTSQDLMAFVAVWSATAAIAVVLAGIETVRRARREHSGLARQMIQSALEQFMPALVVGLLLTVVLIRVAPRDCWMLPGLWEIIFSMGIFASCRFLPRPMFAVGVWYLAAGLASIAIEGPQRMLSPWAMGIPFGVGQLAVAAVLRLESRACREEGA